MMIALPKSVKRLRIAVFGHPNCAAMSACDGEPGSSGSNCFSD